MKKVFPFIFALALCSMSSCGEDDIPLFDCISAGITLNNARQAYEADQSTENCEAYRAAAQNLLDNNCAGNGSDDYQAILDSLGNCTGAV